MFVHDVEIKVKVEVESCLTKSENLWLGQFSESSSRLEWYYDPLSCFQSEVSLITMTSNESVQEYLNIYICLSIKVSEFGVFGYLSSLSMLNSLDWVQVGCKYKMATLEQLKLIIHWLLHGHAPVVQLCCSWMLQNRFELSVFKRVYCSEI